MKQLLPILLCIALAACSDNDYDPQTRPYGVNYNYIVATDSISLIRQQPEEYTGGLPTDTIAVFRDDRIVIADMRAMPADTIDTMFVQVARDQYTIGWTHETELMNNVVPDDPISLFVYTFSGTHVLLTLVLVCLIFVACMVRLATKKKVKMVHLNDIPSLYPTLLCLTVSVAAVLYSYIQLNAPQAWLYFYHNPTLNPLSQPLPVALFLTMVWAMGIIGIAAVDVANRMLKTGEMLLYVAGLVAICAADYLVFSLTTLYYNVGYVLLALYCCFAVYRYVRYAWRPYECGSCGALLRRKGRCPRCGAINE